MADEQLSDLVQRASKGQLSRRQLIRRAGALGLSAAAIAALRADKVDAAPNVPGAGRSSRFQSDPTTLVIADDLAGEWITLDPAVIYEIPSQAAMNIVYETLYHLPDSTKPDQIEPLLAEGMPTVSADGKEVTIKLRQGVKFHHTGNVMTADDWIFSWNRLRYLNDNPAFLAAFLGTFEAVDPQTIKLTLPSPNAALVAILTATPLAVSDSKQVMAQGGTGSATPEPETTRQWMISNSAGTGPYVLASWDIETEVVVKRNPDYWGETPKLDRIVWRNVTDPNTQLQLVQTGEADIAYALDPDAFETVNTDPNLQVLTGPTLNIDFLAMHTSPEVGGPLANKQLRQAIAYAVDYEGISQGLSLGLSVHPATAIPLGLLGAEEVHGLAYKLDLAKAQELFDASGVGPVELTLTYGSGSASSVGVSLETLMPKIQSDLQQIQGLTIKLEPMEPQARRQAFRESKLQFTYSGWSPDYADVHAYAEPFALTGGAAANRVAYSNPRVDELLAQGIVELDPEKRRAIYVEIQKLMIDDAAFAVTEQPTDKKPASKAVQGVTTHSVYMIQLRYASKSA